jgi:catechol 2,3-dioxygenase-like lactoylglutathione lyase family enzyme
MASGRERRYTSVEESDMTKLQNVAVVSVPVSDPDRAKSFYVDTLGMRVLLDDTSESGMRWVQVAPAEGATSLTLVTWFDSMPAGSLRGLVLSSTNLEADYAELVRKGVEFEGPPQQRPWGIETVLSDPDGNRIVLNQS